MSRRRSSSRMLSTPPPSLDTILSNVSYTMRRSWCYKRVMFALFCAACMFVLLKITDPSDNSDTDSYYQDTNSLNTRIDIIARRRKLLLANNTEKYCYNKNDEFGTTIVFIHFNNKWTDLDTCAVKTASIFNPHTPICLLHAGPESVKKIEKILKGLSNVQIAPLDVLDVFDGTPLYDWYVKVVPESPKRRYFHTELLDAIRASYLYKYGGTYLDTDVWTLRSLENLGVNTLAKEATHVRYLSNFVMSFQKRHPFMEEVVNRFNRSVNASRWGSGGTLLLTRVYEQQWKDSNGERRKIKNKSAVNVIDPANFYPVHFGHGPILYQSSAFSRVENMTRNSYTVHLWREVFRSYWTGKSVPQRGSFVSILYDQLCKAEVRKY